MIHSLRCYRKAERRLKTAQRRVSRRRKGSHRRRKAVKLLARAHQKVRRQRQDFQHKIALHLIRDYDMIYHEDLQTANMLRNHHLATSIADAGWSGSLSILSHKAACAGRRVVAVPPAYTSQACSGCGVIVAKGLSVRWHECPDCGTSLHRDHNAAKNIERLGQSLRGGVALAASENRESPSFSRGECQFCILASMEKRHLPLRESASSLPMQQAMLQAVSKHVARRLVSAFGTLG
jgi:IS605 OrfB family transposase